MFNKGGTKTQTDANWDKRKWK